LHPEAFDDVMRSILAPRQVPRLEISTKFTPKKMPAVQGTQFHLRSLGGALSNQRGMCRANPKIFPAAEIKYSAVS
jgi:hypothetical protein